MTQECREKTCVYCRQSGRKITREHLWPAALHQRLQAARQQQDHCFWLSRLDKEIATEPTLRDVCNICNNGPLSDLDAYICGLWDRYFGGIRQRGDELVFEYDYHLLARWLLKLCFNSSRIHGNDVFVFQEFTSYILTGERSDASFRIFIRLVPPGTVPHEDVPVLPEGVESRIWFPEGHRVGFMMFQDPTGRKKLLRAVHLRSFTFLIAFFQPFATESEIGEFMESFMLYGEARCLPSDAKSIALICEGSDAWQSVRDAKIKLIFSSRSQS